MSWVIECPEKLSKVGKQAAAIMNQFMKKYKLQTGGCQTLYHPKEWKARGEEYGTDAELVIVYDGGDLHDIMDGYLYNLQDEIIREFDAIGLYFEPCTSWYCAVYKH